MLLVGWDSADWKIMHPMLDAGQLPGIQRLVEGGASGDLATLEPQLSPMLWTSIATGKMAYHHGVAGFTEVDPRTGSVVPVSAATRCCRTVWEMLGEHGLRSNVVGWFATQGEQGLNGHMVSNLFCHANAGDSAQRADEWAPPPPGTFWPPELEETMLDMRVGPHEIEPSTVLRLLVPDAAEVDQQQDGRLWILAKHLAESFSVHNAAVRLLETDGEWDFFAVYFRAIDEICHHFMPYHPPRMPGVPEGDFERYRRVVEGAYRLHDLMLQRLLALVGEDTSVMLVSDHGFHSDHLRPKFTPRVPAGITVWHRPQGVFVASGPEFKPDELLFGARLLDVAPTILHFFGLPVGRDMEGRVLEQIFAQPRPVRCIDTWERPGLPEKPRVELTDGGKMAILRQFIDLGYIDEVPADPGIAAEQTRRENQWNMARAAVHGGRFGLALPWLEDCFDAAPCRVDYGQLLAHCQIKLGLMDEAEATLASMVERLGANPRMDLLRASMSLQKGDHAAALALLAPLHEQDPRDLQLQLMLARCYLELREWKLAEGLARTAIATDARNPDAACILARIHLHQHHAELARDAALDAIGAQYGNPTGHFLLGAALARLGDWTAAEQALSNCLQLSPAFYRARRLLVRVVRAKGELERAADLETELRVMVHLDQERARQRLSEIAAAAAQRRKDRAEAGRSRVREAERRRAEDDAVEALDFIIVSGLPRSGTSLMMQVLQAGGVPIMTDGMRAPDEDNPLGYLEWEAIKKLAKEPWILGEAKGRAVKVIAALLPALPARHRYKILYMVRPAVEVVESQFAMLGRRGKTPRAEKLHLIEAQDRFSQQVRSALRRNPQVELLEVDFPGLIADPSRVLKEVAGFLGEAFHVSDAVIRCVEPRLHRHQSDVGPSGASTHRARFAARSGSGELGRSGTG